MRSVVFDVAGPEIAVAIGIGAVLLLAMVVLVEALVLWLLRWGSFWRALLDALVMNVVTAIVGTFLIGLIADLSYLGLIIAWVLSVAIEGGVLILLRRHPIRQTWMASLVANSVSYAGLLAMLLLTSR